MLTEVQSLTEEVEHTPRNHQSILILGELSSFLTDFDYGFAGARKDLARIAMDCMSIEGQRMEGADPDVAPEFRAKQRMYCLYALACFRAGHLDPEDVGVMLKALLVSANGAIFEQKTAYDDSVERLTVLGNNIMSRRLGSVVGFLHDHKLLKQALEGVMHVNAGKLTWKGIQVSKSKEHGETISHCAIKSASCFEAVCKSNRAGGDQITYHVNILTGTVLVNGKPPQGLPSIILNHPLYVRVFGARCNFDVAELRPGVWQTTKLVLGRCIYRFSMAGDQTQVLLVEEEHQNSGKVLELLDGTKTQVWAGDLSVRDRTICSHWLCRDYSDSGGGQAIVIRDIDFRSTDVHYILLRDPGRDRWTSHVVPERLRKQCRDGSLWWTDLYRERNDMERFVVLKDDKCPASSLLRVLEKFEDKQFIHAHEIPASGAIILVMPRYGLRFKLEDAYISSLDFLGYHLEPCQMLDDTLPGFHRYLVLKRTRLDGPESRPGPLNELIVQMGTPYRSSDGDEDVKIVGSSECDATRLFVSYDVHQRLRYFDASNTAARLHLAALYAATGSMLIDERVGMTGSEYATKLVRLSFQNWPLTEAEFSHLQNVLSHSQHSPTLALVCRDLEKSSSGCLYLHIDTVEASRKDRLHFPHSGMEGCSLHSKGLCSAQSDYASAYMHERRKSYPHCRRILSEVEESSLLGGMRSRDRRQLWNPAGEVETKDDVIMADADSDGGAMFVRRVESFLSHLAGKKLPDQDGSGWKGSQALCELYRGMENATLKSKSASHQSDSIPQSKASSRSKRSSPDDEFPLSGLNSKNKLGEYMKEQIRESWESHLELMRAQSEWAPPITDIYALADMFADLSSTVTAKREAVQKRVLEHLMRVPLECEQGPKLRMLRAANLMPMPGLPDLLAIMLSPALIKSFNPLLSKASAKVVHDGTLQWAEFCVLEDKMERLCALTCSFRGVEASAMDDSQASAMDQIRSRHQLWLKSEAQAPAMAQIRSEMMVTREWAPAEYPEWLAFEVEGRLQIRPKQYHIANNLIKGENAGSIVQLNMGEGKTRVVIPLIWLVVSRDRSRLVRCNFLTTLLCEGRDFLRLWTCASALCKRIYMFPFHREMDLDLLHMANMHESLQQCRRAGGLVVLAPEHRNSLVLKVQEYYLQGEAKADKMQALTNITQGLNIFDILDESDLELHFQFQLVYAVGRPCALPSSESRFLAVESVLRVVATDPEVRELLEPPQISKTAAEEDLNGSESHFPRRQLIAGNELDSVIPELLDRIAQSLLDDPPHGLWWLKTLIRPRSNDAKCVKSCMTCPNLDADTILSTAVLDIVAPLVASENSMGQRVKGRRYQDLMALRGLLAKGILVHCMKKRFRVEYGLKPGARKRMAVPYRASDTPSERSEFSQPDCALLQTYLSFYYDGLSMAQVEEALAALLHSKFGTEAKKFYYRRWYESAKDGMDSDEHRSALDAVEKIDLSNTAQKRLAFKYYSRNMEAVNFFLAKCVLPTVSQQYQHRLSSSAWNLAENGAGGTTVGFSGTNDHDLLLPTQVKQMLIPGEDELRSTNGKTLDLILRQTNPNQFVSLGVLHSDLGPEWQIIISKCCDFGACALIDCGGTMAGVANDSVARRLLEHAVKNGKVLGLRGVTFFNTKRDGWDVMGFDGISCPKDVSPIRESDTFAFFDESRCRGADLKLRREAVAVLTVGSKTGKDSDKLMQASWRMRRLEEGQRIIFIATSDVEMQIRASVGQDQGKLPVKRLRSGDPSSSEKPKEAMARRELGVKDLLVWVMKNTMQATIDGLTTWADKGLVYATTNDCQSAAMMEETIELEKLYAGSVKRETAQLIVNHKVGTMVARRGQMHPMQAAGGTIIGEIRARADEYGDDVELEIGGLDDECVRELEQEEEKEEESEIQVMCHAESKAFFLLEICVLESLLLCWYECKNSESAPLFQNDSVIYS